MLIVEAMENFQVPLLWSAVLRRSPPRSCSKRRPRVEHAMEARFQ
jgi:hypothetical protein